MPGDRNMKFINYRTLFLTVFTIFIPIGPASAQTSGATLTPAQRIEVQDIIQKYLGTNPEVIIKSIDAFRERKKQDQQNQARLTLSLLEDQVLNDPDSPVAGNPTGDVTVVEFFDYLCTYCKRIIPVIQKLLKQDTNVRYVLKELPILSPDSRLAARAALVVWKHQKEKYFDFHTTLMTSQGRLPEARILRLAKEVGADTTLIKREMRSNEISAMLQRNFDLAQRLGVRGTPGFIIGDKIIPGAIDLTALKSLIAEARERG